MDFSAPLPSDPCELAVGDAMRLMRLGELSPVELVESSLARIAATQPTIRAWNTILADEARAELAKLQAGDPVNRALWERFVAATRVALDRVYARLGVTFDEWLGESAYDAMLPGVVDDSKVRNQTGIKYLMQSSGLGDRILRYATPPCSLGGTRGRYMYVAHSTDQASVSTERKMPSISSNSFCPQVSGGASCTTGSPRSSARQ